MADPIQAFAEETLPIDQMDEIVPTDRFAQEYSIDRIDDIEPPEMEVQKQRGVIDTVKYFLGENVKAVGRGIERIPAGMESVLQFGLQNLKSMHADQLKNDGAVFGISEEEFKKRSPLQQKRIDMMNNGIQNVDRAIETSKRLQTMWNEATMQGAEAPSEEFLKSSPIPFKENFSFTRMFALGAESVPMLGLAAVVTAATKSPIAGAAVLGVQQGAEQANEAIEAGLSIEEANKIFVADAVMLSALETVPLTSFMKGGALPLRMFKVAAQEGGEEALQQLWQNSVAKIGYEPTRKLTEGMLENFIAGFISGGTIGAFGPSGLENQKIIAEAKKAGVDVESMSDIVAEQVIASADPITQAFLEKASPEAINAAFDTAAVEGKEQPVDDLKPEDNIAVDGLIGEDTVEPIIDVPATEKKYEDYIDSRLKEEIDAMGKKKDELEVAKMELDVVQEMNDFFNDYKVNISKNPDIAEELAEIPKKFTTKDPNAGAPDEIMNTLNNADIGVHFETIREMADFMKHSIAREERSKAKVDKLKLKYVTRREDTVLEEKKKMARRGFIQGKIAGRQEVRSAKEIVERRRTRVRAVRDFFQLTDRDLKSISNKDVRLMSNYEFKKFVDDVEAKAAELVKKRDAKQQVMFTIHDLELQKVENLREFMELPTLNNMNVEQLNEFNQALEQFQKGDEFISVRKLQTIDNTELKGVKTLREVREFYAKKAGIPLDSIDNIKVGQLDKMRYDHILAEQNPFYKMLVDDVNGAMIDADQKFFEMEKDVDRLVKKARASRPGNIIDKAVPTDDIVFEWLEAPDNERFNPEKDKGRTKEEIAKDMTDAEIELASYLQARFAQFRDYLLEQGVLKKYRSDYIAHIRRGFLEAWKEDGIINAFKEVFKNQIEDEASFTVLDDRTGQILPMEAFFKFALQRTGNLTPSKNVSSAFKAYTRTFLKKQAIDKVVPSLDMYAYALSPKETTERGLELNNKLVNFVREYLNNKKGRKISLGVVHQGGFIDIALRSIDSFLSVLDLGFNLAVQITTPIGEQMSTYLNLGEKDYAKGVIRMNTDKGKKIIEDNTGFIGKSPWKDLTDTANDIGATFHKGMFILFHKATVDANKIQLLGSLTDEEFESGEISTERLAQMKREMGKNRAVIGAKSIFGSTSVGSTLTKYKTWAIPHLHSVLHDLTYLSKTLKDGKFSDVMASKEFHDVLRRAVVVSLIVLAARGMFEDDDDDSFLAQLLRKAYRESLTLIGALNPSVFSKVRLGGFIDDLGSAITSIILMEEYKTREGYKGVEKLKRTLTPRAMKNLSKKEKKKSKKLTF